MTIIDSVDPATGASAGPVATETALEQVGAITAAAAAAATAFQQAGRPLRVSLLRRIADDLEAGRSEIVPIATRETGLGSALLPAELTDDYSSIPRRIAGRLVVPA